MLNGFNPSTEQILNVLNLTRNSFGRYRDVYIKDGYIVVHTRCGGGNREDYEWVFDDAAEHPWYSHNEDQEFDSTYADIFFKIPETDEARSIIGLLDQGSPPADKWDAIFKALNP